MIYKERVTIEEIEGILAGTPRKYSRKPAHTLAVFPYTTRALSKEEEDRLAEVVISLSAKIDKEEYRSQ